MNLKQLWYSLLDYKLVAVKDAKTLTKKSPPSAWSRGAKGDVLLIQSYGCRWPYLFEIGNLVSSMGYKVHVVEKLKYNTMPTLASVIVVKKFIKENGFKNLTIIAHSKGGLIAKLLLNDPSTYKLIKSVISIATPYKGTIVGYFRKSSRELVPKSSLFGKMKSKRSVNKKVTNIYPSFDNFTIPNSSLHLPGAKNIKLDVIGHTRILIDPKAISEIKKIIDK